jgi:polyisoprenoid-binding protein YceI
MVIQTGNYGLGPSSGSLLVKTGRTGAAAKAGHDLVIEVTGWKATLEVGADGATTVAVDADATSLRVREGTGGMQSLGDDDKDSIHKTIDDDVLKRQDISFRSTTAQPTDAGLRVEGDLTLVGRSHPLTFDVTVADGGRLSATAVVKQTDWGMKPYSALFGTLKVVDEVEVALDATLPAPG